MEGKLFSEVLASAIRSSGRHYDPGRDQGGLRVIMKGSRIVVQRLNRRGVPVRLSAEDMRLIEAFAEEFAPFSALARFRGATETLRRLQATYGVVGRQARGAIEALESLDPGCPNFSSLDDIARAEPHQLPRAYTFVTSPPPMRHIVFRELPTGNLRPDEWIASWPLSEIDLAAARAKSFKEILKVPGGLKVKNLRMHYGDVNRPIAGKATVEHWKKSLKTAQAGALKLMTEFGIQPIGAFIASVRDVFLEAPAVVFRAIGDTASAGLVRMAPSDGSHRATHAEYTFEQRAGFMDVTLVHTPVGNLDRRVARRLEAQSKNAIDKFQQLLKGTGKFRFRP